MRGIPGGYGIMEVPHMRPLHFLISSVSFSPAVSCRGLFLFHGIFDFAGFSESLVCFGFSASLGTSCTIRSSRLSCSAISCKAAAASHSLPAYCRCPSCTSGCCPSSVHRKYHASSVPVPAVLPKVPEHSCPDRSWSDPCSRLADRPAEASAARGIFSASQ